MVVLGTWSDKHTCLHFMAFDGHFKPVVYAENKSLSCLEDKSEDIQTVERSFLVHMISIRSSVLCSVQASSLSL